MMATYLINDKESEIAFSCADIDGFSYLVLIPRDNKLGNLIKTQKLVRLMIKYEKQKLEEIKLKEVSKT